MASSELSITFDIEPIVKLNCAAIQCRFNDNKSSTCMLKHIDINDDGECEMYEKKDGD